jgi:hypothetical protein
MNIWALNKDNSIKHLLLMLAHDMGADAFELIDVESLHPQAVRIGSHDTDATAYLYTYGQADEHYGLHLEYPGHEDSNISSLEVIHENLNYSRLLDILKDHLDWYARLTD